MSSNLISLKLFKLFWLVSRLLKKLGSIGIEPIDKNHEYLMYNLYPSIIILIIIIIKRIKLKGEASKFEFEKEGSNPSILR